MHASGFAPFALFALFATGAALGCAKSAPAAEAMREDRLDTAAATAVPQRADAMTVKPLAKKKFGGEITEKNTTALDLLVKEPASFTAKTVRTEGVVSAVCEHKGCWMEIADASGKAHIKMAGHSFFIPREAAGHRAVIQGKVLTGDKDHCTEEAEQQTGEVAKVEIEANGVEFID